MEIRDLLLPLHLGGYLLQITSPMPLESEPSVVPAVILSDFVIIEKGSNKRSLIGTFDHLSFPQFPAKVGRFFASVWIENVEGTLTELELTTHIKAKGSAHIVFSSSAKMEFGGEQKFTRSMTIAVSSQVIGATFPTPGVYSVVFLLNGDEVGSRDFQVKQIAVPPGESQPPPAGQ